MDDTRIRLTGDTDSSSNIESAGGQVRECEFIMIAFFCVWEGVSVNVVNGV